MKPSDFFCVKPSGFGFAPQRHTSHSTLSEHQIIGCAWVPRVWCMVCGGRLDPCRSMCIRVGLVCVLTAAHFYHSVLKGHYCAIYHDNGTSPDAHVFIYCCCCAVYPGTVVLVEAAVAVLFVREVPGTGSPSPAPRSSDSPCLPHARRTSDYHGLCVVWYIVCRV